MYLLLAILFVTAFFYLLSKVNDVTVYNFDDTTLQLYDKKPLRIAFDQITRVERTLGGGENHGRHYIKYLVTYKNTAGKLDTATFERLHEEKFKWERFKSFLLLKNPAVIISESSF